MAFLPLLAGKNRPGVPGRSVFIASGGRQSGVALRPASPPLDRHRTQNEGKSHHGVAEHKVCSVEVEHMIIRMVIPILLISQNFGAGAQQGMEPRPAPSCLPDAPQEG